MARLLNSSRWNALAWVQLGLSSFQFVYLLKHCKWLEREVESFLVKLNTKWQLEKAAALATSKLEMRTSYH